MAGSFTQVCVKLKLYDEAHEVPVKGVQKRYKVKKKTEKNRYQKWEDTGLEKDRRDAEKRIEGQQGLCLTVYKQSLCLSVFSERTTGGLCRYLM